TPDLPSTTGGEGEARSTLRVSQFVASVHALQSSHSLCEDHAMPTRFSIDRFLNIRSATGPTFSPDGRFVAFLTNITGVMQLWQVPVEGGWPTQLTFTNESVRSAHYSPIRHEIGYSMDTGGNERTQLYLLKGVGGGTDHGIGDGWDSGNLTEKPNAIHVFGGW